MRKEWASDYAVPAAVLGLLTGFLGSRLSSSLGIPAWIGFAFGFALGVAIALGTGQLFGAVLRRMIRLLLPSRVNAMPRHPEEAAIAEEIQRCGGSWQIWKKSGRIFRVVLGSPEQRSASFPSELIESLRDLPELEDLTLVAHESVSLPLGLQSLKNLSTLQLKGKNISDLVLSEVAQVRGLEDVYLIQTSITDEGLNQLAQLGNLQSLLLEGGDVTGATIASLTSNRKLTELFLSELVLSDQGWSSLGQLNQLRSLQLSNVTWRQCAASSISSISNLTRLTIVNAQVTDDDLRTISNLPNLKRLSLSGTDVSKKGLSFVKEKHPQLEVD